MTKTQYFCDICKRELANEECISYDTSIPVWKNPYNMDEGFKVKNYHDFCKECITKIANAMNDIKCDIY